MKDKLIKLLTAGTVEINRVKTALEENGIFVVVKDGFRQGLEAGFAGGTPSAIDLFVSETDFVRASEILNDLKN
jgi:hypothetical protein